MARRRTRAPKARHGRTKGTVVSQMENPFRGRKVSRGRKR